MTSAVLTSPALSLRKSDRPYSTVRSTSAFNTFEREIEQSILRSQFLRRTKDLISLIQRTLDLSQIEPNWDSYGAEPPRPEAIKAAVEFISLSATTGTPLPMRSLPSAEGGVALRFAAADKRALVEFLNTGEVEIMLYNEAGVLEPDLINLGGQEDVLHAVQSHLMR